MPTKAQLKVQFKRAEKLGWIPFFLKEANSVTKGYFDAADLMGIGSRETNLDPIWLTKAGDGGNGYGLMQADKRSFPEYVRSGEWKKADKSIEFGAKVLMMKWRDMESNSGKRVGVTNSKTGKTSYFIAKAASGETAQKIAISSYNCGRWAQYAYAKGSDIDAYSTGKDYARDVMKRAAIFREFLKENGYIKASSSAGASTGERPGSLTEGNAPTDNPPTGDAGNAGNEGHTVIQSADNIVNTGDATASEAPKVVVEKEERVEVKEGFFKRLWAKIVAAATGLGGADALMDKAQQAQTLGLPNAFWTRFFIALCILAGLWLIYELWTGLVHPWVINRRRRRRTDLLVEANTSPNGTVMLAKTADLKKYEAEGWVVVRRGASTISADTGE